MRPRLKDLVTGIPAGTHYRQVAGGGGGYGDPRARAADRVLRDVRDGYVTEAVAREVYGVAIDTATWIVDEAETARLRGG